MMNRKDAMARGRERARRVRAASSAPLPAAPVSPPPNDAPERDDKAPVWKDPGLPCDPERIRACIERIYVDPSKRLSRELRPS